MKDIVNKVRAYKNSSGVFILFLIKQIKVLWPLMHYTMWSDTVDEVSFWQKYIGVNKIFAEEVIKNYNDGDIGNTRKKKKIQDNL